MSELVSMDIEANPEQRRLLTVKQACASLQLSRPVVYDLIRSGRLRSISVGRIHRIPVQAIEDFAAGRTHAGSGTA
ncbi:MAG: helix-turn-helix domain-containing protein [Acidimicrobiales bacterium]